MKKEWIIKYEMNGGEYIGEMIVLAENIKRESAESFIADGVTVKLREVVLSIGDSQDDTNRIY
jgi:hypothetical protein